MRDFINAMTILTVIIVVNKLLGFSTPTFFDRIMFLILVNASIKLDFLKLRH